MPQHQVVVMGVSGSGKTTVAEALAARLDGTFVDADALHPPANVAKMASGTPLTDADRWPWLDAVGAAVRDGGPGTVVMACSSLRRIYRDRIRANAPAAFFLELDAPIAVLRARMLQRVGHFMPPSLLDSQLALLEPLQPGERGARIDVSGTAEQVLARAQAVVERA